MIRRIFTALLIIAALASAVAAVPGLAENVAYACPKNNPDC
jgi:hypothetical protein